MSAVTISGSLNSGTQSATGTISPSIGACGFSLSASVTLGSYPLGALGTVFDVQLFSPGLSGNGLVIYAQDSYQNPSAPINTVQVFSNVAPDGGSNTNTIVSSSAGIPGTVISLLCNGVIDNLVLSGTNLTGDVTVPPYGTWAGALLDNNASSINDISIIKVATSIGINASYSASLYSLADNAEVLLLNNPVNVVAGQRLTLVGANAGALATGLVTYQDGFSQGSMTAFSPGTSWSGNGPLAAPGTHTLYVKDAATGVVSNTVTYSLPLLVQRAMIL